MEKKNNKKAAPSPRKGSMRGKHNPDLVLLGSMVTPRKKAIALVTLGALATVRDSKSLTLTDMLWEGVEVFAKRLGIIDANGEVTDKYRDAITIAEYQVREKKSERKAR